MAYNTGNPIGSTDPRDLLDNSKIMDKLLNGSAASVADRFGVSRRTIAGMESAFDSRMASLGYDLSLGDYAAGKTITDRGQVVLRDGEYYKAAASATLPIVLTGTWGTDSVSLVGAGDAVLRQDLAADDGAIKIGFQDVTVGSKLSELISAGDGGSPGDGIQDDTGYLQELIDTHGQMLLPPNKVFRVTGLIITEDTIVYSLGGKILAAGATDRCFTVSNGARLTTVRLDMVGGRYAGGLDSNTTNSAVVVDDGTLSMDGGSVSYFAGRGIQFVGGGSYENRSKIHGDCRIHNNGTGIDLGDYEYADVEGVNIYKNGLNAAGTSWSAIYGPGTGYGITGRFANCQCVGNTISSNAGGLYLNSIGGSNPDHNKIIGNTINHNYAFGMVLQGLQNYETVLGNTCLSNVTRAEAPTVVFAPRGTSVDAAVIDCIAMQFGFNDVGPGSDTQGMPIFGHARCRYTNNNWVYYPPVEVRHPETGAALVDYYGYDKNGDNVFSMNVTRNESTAGLKPVILSDSIRTVLDQEIESSGAGAGSGGGMLRDDVINKVAYTNGWSSVGGAIESYYFRKAGKQVTLYIYATAPASIGTSITTLPEGYRPVGAVQTAANVGSSLSSTYATIFSDGTVTVVGATAGQPVLIQADYVTGY